MSDTDKEKYENLIALLEIDLREFLSNDTRDFKLLNPYFVSVTIQWFGFIHEKTTEAIQHDFPIVEFIVLCEFHWNEKLMELYKKAEGVECDEHNTRVHFAIKRNQSQMLQTIKELFLND